MSDIKDRLRSDASLVVDEAEGAQNTYGDFASMHEAYGVLLEEVDELFAEVKRKQVRGAGGKLLGHADIHARPDGIRREALQIAAVALRIAEQAERVTR